MEIGARRAGLIPGLFNIARFSFGVRIAHRKFDAGGKIVDQLDLHKTRRVGTDAKRVNVDFPAWMVNSLDCEARRLGVTRQSLIKLWLADKLGQPAIAAKR